MTQQRQQLAIIASIFNSLIFIALRCDDVLKRFMNIILLHSWMLEVDESFRVLMHPISFRDKTLEAVQYWWPCLLLLWINLWENIAVPS